MFLATVFTVLATLAAPVSAAVAIHPGGNDNFCLDVQGGVIAVGTRVQIYECNCTPAQKWEFTTATTSLPLLKVAGTNLCIDSIGDRAYGVHLVQCPDGHDRYSAWLYTTPNEPFDDVDDGRIVQKHPNSGGTFYVLDLQDGLMANGATVQLWDYFAGNKNQYWTLT